MTDINSKQMVIDVSSKKEKVFFLIIYLHKNNH